MYEIPKNLKNLYRHWQNHVNPILPEKINIVCNKKILRKIDLFIKKRMEIWHKKKFRKSPPYTSDPIISKYRFCNIYRELDRQTIQIHYFLGNLRNNFPLWLLNVAFCRFTCNPDIILKIGFLNFNKKHNQKIYEKLIKLPRPKFGSAYVFPISIILKSDYPTREKFLCFYLPKIISKIAKLIQDQNKISISECLNKIIFIFKFNFKFHWTEILIDVAYQYPKFINLYGKFPIGPGSIPTMKLLNKKIDPENIALFLINHKPRNFPYLTYNNKPIILSTENWEGIGCEFRKYSNLKNGTGRKRKYTAFHEWQI
ncbi:hypothetical protein HZC33_03020 [Candidatus Wolfebacteria bacterium]|nr:hypothetical protein [Candidatus Wolfebacteria bacterium]